MGETQEVQLSMESNGNQQRNSLGDNSFPDHVASQSIISKKQRYYRWFRIILYSAFMLLGQSAAVLLQRLYYEKGGKSKWLETLLQPLGFPLVIPYYFISARKDRTKNNSINSSNDQPSVSKLALVYVSIGVSGVSVSYLSTFGIGSLPVSTYSLIYSSQLAFTAFFSYFINSLKLTPYTINSLILLTISSTLLVFQAGSETDSSSPSTHITKKKYAIGFICTVAAAAVSGFLFSVTQLAFKKVFKIPTIKVVLEMAICVSFIASCATLVGFFASGEWKGLKNEMEQYEMGKASYILNLTFTAIIWQLITIGSVGLIFEVSSLFSNAISVLGLPLVPISAVIIFKDKMNGIKAISLVLAVWGFISYGYQQYLEERQSNKDDPNARHGPNSSTL